MKEITSTSSFLSFYFLGPQIINILNKKKDKGTKERKRGKEIWGGRLFYYINIYIICITYEIFINI